MKNVCLWVLIVVNSLLLLWFVGRGHETAALAQQQPPAAQRAMPAGSYLAIPGRIVGGAGSDVVYILDSRNQLLTAVQQNQANVNVMPPIDLTRIFHR